MARMDWQALDLFHCSIGTASTNMEHPGRTAYLALLSAPSLMGIRSCISFKPKMRVLSGIILISVNSDLDFFGGRSITSAFRGSIL